MPTYTTPESITEALKRFNKRSFNAGLRFRYENFNSEYSYILASLNFAYYVNVDIEFKETYLRILVK